MQHMTEFSINGQKQPTPVQAWLKTGLLVGLALYFIYNIFSGNLANYINARFAWLSYVAAALFLLLAAANLHRLLRGEEFTNQRPYYHSSMSWGVLLVVSLPLVMGTLIPSRPLGASAIDGGYNTAALAATDNTTTFTVPPLERNILDWIRIFNVSDDLLAFEGQEADIVAFVYVDDTFPENHFLAARFIISCCVADSTAVGLPVVWLDEELPLDTWVQIFGRFRVEDFKGEQRPVLHPVSIEVIDQPDHPYLYP